MCSVTVAIPRRNYWSRPIRGYKKVATDGRSTTDGPPYLWALIVGNTKRTDACIRQRSAHDTSVKYELACTCK
jgi:hypothetical protein